MPAIPSSADSLLKLVEHRRRTGAGRLDECWEGVWHLTDPTGPHQRLAFDISRIHAEAVEDKGLGTAWISINVTDREEGWIQNHRCPDGAVILNGNPGRWVGENQAAFLGGPDLILEVRSPDDDTYLKLPFYAERRVHEVLVVDQESGRPELWRLEDGEFRRQAEPLRSNVTGLEYRLGPEGLEIQDPASGRMWKIQP
jgi:Uma2 family endonuclease